MVKCVGFLLENVFRVLEKKKKKDFSFKNRAKALKYRTKWSDQALYCTSSGRIDLSSSLSISASVSVDARDPAVRGLAGE